MLNQCTQWHFPERIGEEMHWWVCPSPTNRRVWFVRHPSDRFCRVPELRLSQSGPYLCSKPGPAWFPAHLFQVQHIEVISPRKMEPLRKPDIKFTQVTYSFVIQLISWKVSTILLSSYQSYYPQYFMWICLKFFHLYRLSPNGITDLHRQWMGGLGVWKKLSNSESCHR